MKMPPEVRRGRPRLRPRIGHKLVVSFVLLVMVVVGTSGWVLFEMTRRSLEWQMRKHLVSVAQLLASAQYGDVVTRLRPGDESFGLYPRLAAQLQHSREILGAARIYVFDPRGRSLLDTEEQWPIGREYPHLQIRDRMEVKKVLEGEPTCSVLFTQGGVPYMTGYAPVWAEKRVVAAVGVDIGAGFVESIRTFGRWVLAFSSLGALLTVVVALGLARSITRPVQRLVAAAQEIGRGNLGRAVDSSSKDELGYLGETMEEMRRKLLARDAQLRQMLGGVAHEIRNPLGGIELYAGLIAAQLPEEDARKRHIQKVIEEVRTLHQVLSEFLHFARPAPANPVATPVERLVDDALFLLAPEMDQVRVQFRRDVAPGLEAWVDGEQVKRALFNLMKNGVQAMRGGGVLEVRAREAGPEVEIEIQDSGTGMAPQVRARLFEPFFTTKEKGSGLGLAVVQKTLAENGGRIEMESEEGVGTVCRLHLPRAGSNAERLAR
ncbi:MAG: ATP-binding protein [Candidatus Latescibacterota bacterium]